MHVNPIPSSRSQAQEELDRARTKMIAVLRMHQNRIADTSERTLKLLHEIQAERRAREMASF